MTILANRSISVKLGLNVADFVAGAKTAASSLEQVVKAGDKTGKVAETGLGRLEQSARLQGAEWQTVGTHLLGVGTAMGAVGAAIGVTGGNYNRLQQTSRAALSTMLGGAQAANAQMDKLNEWATKSPFSRAVWIEAQQQLLAFGVEAQKVIPYMDAVQNAVAAAGGNETHLRGIVEIMAKIQSSSKITAMDLNQMGNWGVNAAELIGLSMGKTGAQIREEITAGTLDAGVALDALANGMSTKFAGAAAGLKGTFDGAFDRVKAAFRDLSAELMEPLIGSQGGGILTGALNSVADLMRAFQKLPTPVKDFTGAMGLATTATALGAGAFMTFVPKVLELQRAMATLGNSGIPVISKLASNFASVGPNLASALTSLTSGFSNMGTTISGASELGLTRMQALRVGVGQAAAGIGSAAKNIGSSLVNAFGGIQGFAATAAIAGVTTAIMHFQRKSQEAAANAKAFADTLDDVTGAATRATREWAIDKMLDGAGAEAFEKFGVSIRAVGDAVQAGDIAKLKEFRAAIYEQDPGMTPWGDAYRAIGDMDLLISAAEDGKRYADDFAEGMDGAADATDGAADAAEGAAGAFDSAGDSASSAAEAVQGYIGALRSLIDFQNASANSVLAARDSQSAYQEALVKANEALAANGATLDLTTEAGRENQAALDGLAKAVQNQTSSMLEARDANGNMYYSLEEVRGAAETGYDSFVALAEAFGRSSEEAHQLAVDLGLFPDNVETKYALHAEEAKQELAEVDAAFDALPEDFLTTIEAYGDQAVAVAEMARAAIEDGIPEEKVTEILANNAVTGDVAAAQAEIDAVRQKRRATIEALNRANPEVNQAQRSVDSVHQTKVPTITANNGVSGVVSTAQAAINSLTGKVVDIVTRHRTEGTRRASGGPVFGAGSTTSDSIPVWLSNSEHVVSAREVSGFGGHAALARLRSMARAGTLRDVLGFADGGTPGGVPVPASTMGQAIARSSQKVVTVTVNSNDIINNPVAVPDSVKRAKELQLAASLAKGLV